MSIITLTTDWGLRDNYVASVKGRIFSYSPGIIIIDISHQVPVFDIIKAAFLIKSSFLNFPPGTVHIIGIDEEASIETPHLAVFFKGHYFIGADNGIFTLICNEKPDRIIEINIPQDSDYFTFSSRDVFAKAACHLASGKNIDELGDVSDFKNKKISIMPVIDGNTIRGSVIYIDNYENLITNISQSIFKEYVKNKKFSIILPAKYKIEKINKSYKDVSRMELVAVFNSLDLMEIAMNGGNVASLLGLGINSVIRIEFE